MQFLMNYLDDIFYWLGAILIIIAAYELNPIAAHFAGGIFCLIFSFLIGKARAKQSS